MKKVKLLKNSKFKGKFKSVFKIKIGSSYKAWLLKSLYFFLKIINVSNFKRK